LEVSAARELPGQQPGDGRLPRFGESPQVVVDLSTSIADHRLSVADQGMVDRPAQQRLK
jgi:hypothetical protein